MERDAVLIAHPTTPAAAESSIAVQALLDRDAGLALRYVLSGRMESLSLPAVGSAERSDRLWEHTCFEAFVKGEAGGRYLEFNLAPSRRWAAYAFSGYRQRDEAWAPPTPAIEIDRGATTLELRARIPLEALRPLCPSRTLQLALCAVIEARDGALSYWALAHPPGRPDFHHADGFVLSLDVVSAMASQPVADLP